MAALEDHPAFKAAHTILLYHSLKDEVDTHNFIRKWSRYKRILLPAVVKDAIDLIIVPGVGFDRQGNRLGRGKGYYDRLLPRIPSAYKIGICFPFQLVEEIPAEPFDIRMDEIVTKE